MTWSAAITRSTSGTIEVEVDAATKEEAEAKIKHRLLCGEYDQRLLDAITFNAECEEDEVFDIKMESEDEGV